MRRIIFFVAAITAGWFILIESGVSEALLTFLLSGSVPGTSLTISPYLMIAGLAATAWLVLFRLTAFGALNIVTVRRLISRYAKRQQRMPKRRYRKLTPARLDR